MPKTCLDMVYELAKVDPRVVFIGSDLGPGVLEQFRDEYLSSHNNGHKYIPPPKA